MNTFCKVVIALLTIAQLAIFFTSHSVLIPFMTFWIWCALVVPFAVVGMLFRPRDKVVVIQAPAVQFQTPAPRLLTSQPQQQTAGSQTGWMVLLWIGAAALIAVMMAVGFV